MSRSLKFHTFFHDDNVNNVSIVVVVAKEAVLETVVIVGVANNKGGVV